MILVDKDIKRRKEEIFLNGYNEQNVHSVSYDLSIDKMIDANTRYMEEYSLKPFEIIQIKCNETLRIPNDLIGIVKDKNSRIRQGLMVCAPVYQPGHETPVYLRLQNVSSNQITVKKNDIIAQILFETLTDVPEEPYNMQRSASFNNEDMYRGLGNYKSEFDERTQKYITVKENLDKKESTIYGNILTLMGIFVSIFSLISVNFSALNQSNITIDFIITMNLSLGIIITLFMGLILIFLNKAKNKTYNIVFAVIFLVLVASLIFVLI